MRINLLIFIALTLSLIGCQEKQFNKSTLQGSWLFDDESAIIELNSTDNRYTLEIPHATLSMKGNWEVNSSKIGNKETVFLILSNETPKRENNLSDDEFYFKYYFFTIDSIGEKQLLAIDISSKNSVRRNKQFTFKKKTE